SLGCDSGESGDGKGGPVTPPDFSPASIEQVADHKGWGWETFVLENGYIRLAAVPAIGGRVMEFSLNDHESIWVNQSQVGSTPSPSAGPWPNHGGYKNWPAPQSRWNWPPPPTLDYGPYTASIVHQSADSVSVRLEGPVEQIRTPGLRFARTITVYAGSSRARVEQTIVNEGSTESTWSVWDITQTLAQHAPARDFDNFRVYFPINPNSRYGEQGVRTDRSSAAWAGPIAGGIYEVRFSPDNAKLFADSRAGWVCYVDLRDGYAYAKTFPVFPEESYPDQGSDVEVYVSNQNYYEVEVLSPMASIPGGGGSYTFTEDWWAARTEGPVLALNGIGLVNDPLEVTDVGRISGTFGVFHAGLASVVFVDANNQEVGRSDPLRAEPTELLKLDLSVEVPTGAVRADLIVDAPNGARVGVLTSVGL
ncbi:MAG TPA: hypothetical protein VF190_12485, partial [Rhodothermales bacterium]